MDNPNTTKDLSWHAKMVLDAQAGNAEAFEALAVRYRAAVLAVTFMRTGNRDDAEDLVQEVFVKSQDRLSALKDPEAFPGWLRAIASNACGTWYRRLKPVVSLDVSERAPLQDYSAGPLQALLEKEKQKEWRKALLMLPVPNRYTLLMHIWGGYSYQEIAEFLDVPMTTVEGRIYRAKKQLRTLLQSKSADLLGESIRKWQKEDG